MSERFYDLIEFKSGAHIPVPRAMMLMRTLGYNEDTMNIVIDSIPVSHKVRGNSFFRCKICKTPSFYSGICGGCTGRKPVIDVYGKVVAFFNKTELEDERKDRMLIKIIKKGRYSDLKYVRSIRMDLP